MIWQPYFFFFFFFNDTATTEIYTLSLHDALPICFAGATTSGSKQQPPNTGYGRATSTKLASMLSDSKRQDRKSTRLNSSHLVISYAVFCLKKKKTKYNTQ